MRRPEPAVTLPRLARRRAGRLGVLALTSALAVAAAWTTAPVGLARFTSSAGVAGTMATDTLEPPTGLTATGGTAVALAWTPSADAYAAGYRVLRASVSGGPYTQVATITPGSASSTTDSPPPGTYHYVLRSYYQGWTSSGSNEAAATVTAATTSTGFEPCTTQAADTGGDGDGYESSPGRACVDDSSFAVDANTGTSTSLSCADPGKDRHRFWGFALGLPGSVSSVDGIEVRADLALNNNSGTNLLCAQLSWDGGASWTAAQSVPVASTPESTYVLGGAADTWGRAWTASELSAANLRVRLIDASSRADKDFRLDYVAVQVTYTP